MRKQMDPLQCIEIGSRKRKSPDKDNNSGVPKRKRTFGCSESLERVGNVTFRTVPEDLISCAYKFNFYLHCSITEYALKSKYPSISVKFSDSAISPFGSVVLSDGFKSNIVEIVYVDEYFKDNKISFPKLFNREKRSKFFINNLFDGFIKDLMCQDISIQVLEYFIVFTNSDLDLTHDTKLMDGQFKNYFSCKFKKIEVDILDQFFLINGRAVFHQFSQDKSTRNELLKILSLSASTKKLLRKQNISQEEMKNSFLDRVVFAINEPNRQALSAIVKKELNNGSIPYDYITLQNSILRHLQKNHGKEKNKLTQIFWELNFLASVLHSMYLRRNISSVNFEQNCDALQNILIDFKGRIISLRFLFDEEHSVIDYKQLFPAPQLEKKSQFSINRYFNYFIDNSSGEDIEYFILYASANLDMDEGSILKSVPTDYSLPLKFDKVVLESTNVIKDCTCIKVDSIYHFSTEETTRSQLFKLLKARSFLPEQRLIKLKETFLNKLIFATHQPSITDMVNIINNEINVNSVPYAYDELLEISLRWLEGNEYGPITRKLFKKLMRHIKNNRSSYKTIEKDITDESKFARSVVGREGTPAYYEFLNFLVRGDGAKYLENLKQKACQNNVSSILHGAGSNASTAFENLYNTFFNGDGSERKCLKSLHNEGVNLASVSNILHGARSHSAVAFKQLYKTWFDKKGNKKPCLKILEDNGVNLVNVSSILGGAGSKASSSFKDLYNLWFDDEGNTKQCLKSLIKNDMNLSNLSGILNGAGSNAATSFKELHNLWFDNLGNKTHTLQVLEKNDIRLSTMSGILHHAGSKAPTAFRELYELWFDEHGNKKRCLLVLENNGVHLTSMTSILAGSGSKAAKLFSELYDAWFDELGNKKQCLVVLYDNGMKLSDMSSILGGAACKAVKAFKDLYDLWFDRRGNKTKCLSVLAKNGINISNISGIIGGAGLNSSKTFKDLYNIWFDRQGNKKQCLKVLENNDIALDTISSILHRAGSNAVRSFNDLYNVWFDEHGQRRHCLKILEESGLSLKNMATILGGSGSKAAKSFRELYDFWFDEEGNKSPQLAHFIERNDRKCFTMHNLSSILGGSGSNSKVAFEKMHQVFFTYDGQPTKLLIDFYNAGFTPSNLSCLLCKSGTRVSESIAKIHEVCFREGKGKILNDFDKVGFRKCDLCSLLSGSTDSLEEFHNFCFRKKTKKYLKHFLCENAGFTPNHLSQVLHGARNNICLALTDFHNVCFDDTGQRTQLLNKFFNVGFTTQDICNVLCMTGNNAASILRKFYTSCFEGDFDINNFFNVGDVFTPKNLCKIFYGIGTDITVSFVTLYHLCFDASGNKSKNLDKLLSEHTTNEIIKLLHREIRVFPT